MERDSLCFHRPRLLRVALTCYLRQLATTHKPLSRELLQLSSSKEATMVSELQQLQQTGVVPPHRVRDSLERTSKTTIHKMTRIRIMEMKIRR